MHKRDEIIAAIKRCAERLGRAPSQAEFRRASKISWYQVYKHFRGMRQAVRAAGLEPGPRGSALDINALTLDWAGVVRKLGRLPSRAEYCEHGIHHAGTLHARIVWSQMAHKFVLLVKDVVKIVVGKFPLLETSIQPSALSTQPEGSNWQLANSNWQEQNQEQNQDQNLEPQRTRRNAEAGEMSEPERIPLKTIEQEPQPRAAVPHEHGMGMRLGKVVAAALAIEILMAAERSSQQSALSNQPEESNWQSANNNWHEQNQDQNLEPQRSQRNTKEMHGLMDKDGTCGGQAPCGRPVVYGEPLGLAAMAHAPTNELGVLFLFGIVAADLGFRVERLQAAFPDCEAKREVAPGKWELVLLELEIYSRNFKSHRHDPRGCHGIVCWKHNWPDCPEWLEVIELSKVVKRLGDRT
jgi:Homing endonuclease associated repeat